MSKFVIDTEKPQEGYSPAYEMNPDLVKGFKTAVSNGMTRLAMEYLVRIVDILVEEVDDEAPTPTAAKKAPAKKGAAKKTAAKVDDTTDEEDAVVEENA